jgi:AcrR family transcriptional regulator
VLTTETRNGIQIRDRAVVSDRRRQPEQTRARLVDAAARSFAERGYAVTTVQQICQLAGVSVGAFYYHFQDKPGITVGVLEREQDRYLARLAEIDLRRPSTMETALTELLHGPNAPLYRAMREAAEIEPTVREADRYLREVARQQLIAAVKRSRQTPSVGGFLFDASSVAWTLLALLREAIAGEVGPEEPVARAIAKVISHSAFARTANDR